MRRWSPWKLAAGTHRRGQPGGPLHLTGGELLAQVRPVVRPQHVQGRGRLVTAILAQASPVSQMRPIMSKPSVRSDLMPSMSG